MAKLKPVPPWIAKAHPAFQRENKARGNTGDMAKEYDSTWRRYSLRYLRDNPLCVKCGALATTTDHIIPLRQGGSKYDMRNHQALCNKHHAQKSGQEGRGIYEDKVGSKHGYIPARNKDKPAILGNQSYLTQGDGE